MYNITDDNLLSNTQNNEKRLVEDSLERPV